MKEIGYTKPLFILAFDHRASFSRDLLAVAGEPTAEEVPQIQQLKGIIFSGFKQAVAKDIPKAAAAILIDEQYGSAIIAEAKSQGINFVLSVEKSGQAEFTLEYGGDFAEHINKFNPPFVKALVRYNPAGDAELNKRQLDKLKKFSDWCSNEPTKFLIELLVPATTVFKLCVRICCCFSESSRDFFVKLRIARSVSGPAGILSRPAFVFSVLMIVPEVILKTKLLSVIE